MFSAYFLLCFKQNPNKATRGGILEGTENTTIANGIHLNDYLEVRDELLKLGD